MTRPYLSIVVTARNDDHGGNLLRRMQTFVNCLLSQCQRHQLPAELVIVEWNPPADRPPLAEALSWPDEGDFCQVRIIEVGAALHRRFTHSSELPLYQMIAKNAGIRRARGEFILVTNIDILISDELIRFISDRQLKPGKMYRIDRHDVMSDVPVSASVDEQLAYCRTHLLRVNTREGTFRLGDGGTRVREPSDIVKAQSGLSLGGGWFPPESGEGEVFRWVTNDAEIVLEPSEIPDRVMRLEVEPGPGLKHEPFLLELREEGGASFSSWVHRRSVIRFAVPDSNGGAVRLWLRASPAGSKVASDPRKINFRVFRCELGKKRTDEANIARKSPSLVSRLVAKVRRRPAGMEPPPDGTILGHQRMVPSGVYAIWGDGWYGAESFQGESFRWMKGSGAVALFLPPGSTNSISLQVEAGPALGFRRFDLEVADQWGKLLATAKVRRRTRVAVPLPRRDGAHVLLLSALGGAKPKETPGDPRSLAVRLFRCDWTRSSDASGGGGPPVEVGFPGSGVWCGQGFARIGGDHQPNSATFTEAELVVRVPDGATRNLILEASLVPGVKAEPCELVVDDSSGRRLCSGKIGDGKQELRIPDELLSGHLYAIRLRANDGARHDPDHPIAQLTAVIWSATAQDEPIRVRMTRTLGTQVYDTPPEFLHVNGCGDFTLMAQEHWMDLRGYPEFDMFSMNLDALLCYTAHHANVVEEVLEDPMRVYHIEHGIGSGWTPEGQRKLFARIAAKGLSSLDYQEVLHCARIMKRFHAPMIFNHEDWGFAHEELKETCPQRLDPQIIKKTAHG